MIVRINMRVQSNNNKPLASIRRPYLKANQNMTSCYGCQKKGFIKSNCPNCNSSVKASSVDIDESLDESLMNVLMKIILIFHQL